MAVATRRAFSYSRVSSDAQTKGSGMERQDLAAARWCQANGYALDDTVVSADSGRSAFHGEHLAEGGALARFLELAQAGQLGPEPVLLVEAIDRLSRLEPMDGLRRVVFALVDAGVAIITLEDGSRYDRQALNHDPAALIVLVVKIQAAHDYSRRLGARVAGSWDRTIAQLQAGGIARPQTLRCWWHDYSPQDGFTLNEHAETVRWIYRTALDQGAVAIARELNDRGIAPPRGSRWSPPTVRRVLINPAAVGHVCLFDDQAPGLKGKARKARYQREPLLIRDVFPPVVSEAEAAAARAAIAARQNNHSANGPNGDLRYIGQGLTRCDCGDRAGVTSSKHDGKLYRYVRCLAVKKASGHSARAFRLQELTAHLLIRLQPAQLEALVAPAAEHHDAALERARRAVRDLQGKLALAQEEASNTAAAVKAAAKAGGDLSLLQLLNEAATEAASRVAEIGAAAADAALRLDQLTGSAATVGRLGEAVTAALQAFADGEDTAEQRRSLNIALRRAGIGIHLSSDGSQVGLQVGDGPIDWQPLNPKASLIALREGAAAAVLRTGSRGQEQVAIPIDSPAGQRILQLLQDGTDSRS